MHVISSCCFVMRHSWTQNTREHKTMHSWAVWKNTETQNVTKTESDADLWSHSLAGSEHFNPISSEEITLLLVRCPAAEATQMSPNGTGVNNPFDYCYYFALGLCFFFFITRPDRKRDSALLRPSETKEAQLARIKSRCIYQNTHRELI